MLKNLRSCDSGFGGFFVAKRNLFLIKRCVIFAHEIMIQRILRQQPPAMQMLFLMSIFFLMQLLLGGAFSAILQLAEGKDVTFTLFSANPEKYPTAVVLLSLLNALLSFLVPASLFARLISDRPAAFLGLNNKGNKNIIAWIIVLGICMMFFLPAIAEALQKIGLGQSADELQKQRQAMEAAYFVNNDIVTLLRNIFLLAFVPAFCEELFFRGILQRFSFLLLKKKWPAIIFTSLIFAAIHNSIYNFLPIVIASCLLGYIYFSIGNLWMNILLHFVYNAAQVIVLYFVKNNKDFAALAENNSTFSFAAGAIALIIAVICVAIIHKKRTPILLNDITPIAPPSKEEY